MARKSSPNAKTWRHDEANHLGIQCSEICCLRLAPVSGHIGVDGAVAEWLKAAVC